MNLSDLSKHIREINLDHGFDSTVTHQEVFSEKLLLMISELSEALEEFRDHHSLQEIYYNDSNPQKPEGIPVELADCLIRLLDFCEANQIPLEQAIELKLAYNKTREWRHGGKKA